MNKAQILGEFLDSLQEPIRDVNASFAEFNNWKDSIKTYKNLTFSRAYFYNLASKKNLLKTAKTEKSVPGSTPYGGYTPSVEIVTPNDEPLDINFRKLYDTKFPDSVFQPLQTNSLLDTFVSRRAGFMPGTITIVVGDPGAGKSTKVILIGKEIKRLNPDKKILMISSELDELNLFETIGGYEAVGDMDLFFVDEYCDGTKRLPLAIKQVLSQDWDLIILDSFEDLKDKLSDESDMRPKEAEMFLLNLMIHSKSGKPIVHKDGTKEFTGSFTTFLCIQQMTKGGDFAGSNKLKHNTDAMLHVKLEPGTKQRYCYYSKNRRGEVNLKLYYKKENNQIIYDVNRWNRQLRAIELKTQIEAEMDNQETTFEDKLNQTKGANISISSLIEIDKRNERLKTNGALNLVAEKLNSLVELENEIIE